MTRALGPRHAMGDGSAITIWFALLAVWSVPLLLAGLWAAAHLATAIGGGTVAPFGIDFARHVLSGATGRAWPGAQTSLVVTCAAGLAAGVAAAGFALLRLIAGVLPEPGDPVSALRRNPGLARLKSRQAARHAKQLRPAHPGPTSNDVGLPLGNLQRRSRRRRVTLYASWEDTIAVFMGPRTGKTTALTVPAVLHAPGPVVATSNKADLWAATATLREEAGRVWLFDPQHITHQPPTLWWDPLQTVTSVEEAHRLAGHFVLTIDDGTKRDLWGPAAQELLSALFLAAATSDRTLRDVALWLDQAALPTPAELLEDAGFELLASSLRGAQTGAPETRDGIYQTARTAAKALRDEHILTWITPQLETPHLQPTALTRSRDTLYLLSKDASAASPLIAALTDAAMRAAVLAAEAGGGRLDPPMVVALDEAANICRIADLPHLYSHLGSRGVVPLTILQSYEQGAAVWGEQGMAALWGASTCKLIGAGVDSPRLARDLATLIGQHDVAMRSTSFGDGRASHQVSLQRRDILEPAALRSLPAGSAVLLSTGGRPALLHLRPYYRGAEASRINAARSSAEQAIAAAARTKEGSR